MAARPDLNRLEQTFQGRDLSAHGAQWDGLWKDSFTPWDRGGPSLALYDVLQEHGDLVPRSQEAGRRRRALVPGCGRGHDVLLLSALGYDAFGLDYSSVAVANAIENEKEFGAHEMYQASPEGLEKGAIKWLTGDFFADGFLDDAGASEFDLIFDYTFFCALPPSARPKWAKRMSQLLNPDGGRLVCLEWPLGKPASSNGPPWGVTGVAYELHLSRPGEEIEYAQDGSVPVPQLAGSPAASGALKRLARFNPKRTHRAGTHESGEVFDFISVWSH